MSSNSHPDTLSSQFRAIFDAALAQYTRKTGKNIDADPLTAKLRTCMDPSEVYAVLREQAQNFDEFRNGGRKEQIMKKLKPIIDVLFTLSNGGVVGNGIDLVSSRLRSLFCGRFLTYRIQKFPPANAIIAGIGLLLAVRISFPLTSTTDVTKLRPLRA